MIRLKDLLKEEDKRFDIPQNMWTPIMRSELPRFKRIIFDLIKTAYSPIGGHSNVKDKEDLPAEGDFFDVIDVDGDDEIDAATIAKYKPSGKKFVALGHDGSSAGKSAAVNHQVDKLKSGGYYVEVSGKIADILITKYNCPVVTDQKEVEKVLGKKVNWTGKNKENPSEPGDGWYIRSLGGHDHSKILLGRPKV